MDYKKAFDTVNLNLLLYKLANIGIHGSMYKVISAMYVCPRARVILQNNCTEYFDCPMGVKQGDCLSPTLFSIYVNDLANEIKNSQIGVKIDLEGIHDLDLDSFTLSLLLYADDIVLLAETEEDMQSLLLIVQNWCQKWRLEVNLEKTNILHVRNKRKPQSRFMFLFNCRPVPYCQDYKYLGCTINEFFDYSFTVNKLVESASRALGALITKMAKNKGFPYAIFSKLYETCVSSISMYGGEVFGYAHYDSLLRLQLRAARSFLGIPKNIASYGIVSELDWLLPNYQTQVKMIRFLGRLFRIPSTRLLHKIFQWDLNMNENVGLKTWSSEVKEICQLHNMLPIFQQQVAFPTRSVIDSLKSSMLSNQLQLVEHECRLKPKLRTFNIFKDFTRIPPHVGKPLTFIERKTLSKLRLGVLPLRIETARFTRPVLPESQRFCYCNSGEIETEYHLLFECQKYSGEREAWFVKMNIPQNFSNLPAKNQLQLVLNEPDSVRHTAQYLVKVMDSRSLLNKLY